jgi:hypothetical protein
MVFNPKYRLNDERAILLFLGDVLVYQVEI